MWYHIFAVVAYWLPNWAVKWKALIDNVVGSRAAVMARKRDTRADEGVEDDSEGPNVGLEVTLLVLDNLRGHEADSTGDLLNALILTKLASEAEIANLNFWRSGRVAEENIQMLQVAVDNASLVNISDTLGDLEENVAGLLLWESVSMLTAQVVE